jgi:hypothetical protein
MAYERALRIVDSESNSAGENKKMIKQKMSISDHHFRMIVAALRCPENLVAESYTNGSVVSDLITFVDLPGPIAALLCRRAWGFAGHPSQ